MKAIYFDEISIEAQLNEVVLKLLLYDMKNPVSIVSAAIIWIPRYPDIWILL